MPSSWPRCCVRGFATISSVPSARSSMGLKSSTTIQSPRTAISPSIDSPQERQDRLGPPAVLPPGVRRGRIVERADRSRRRAEHGEGPYRGRQDHAELEFAAAVAAEEPGQAAPEHVVIAQQTIPRGGTLTIDPVGEGEAMRFRVTAAGLYARVPQNIVALLGASTAAVDAHAVQPLYAAAGAGLRVDRDACARGRNGGDAAPPDTVDC